MQNAQSPPCRHVRRKKDYDYDSSSDFSLSQFYKIFNSQFQASVRFDLAQLQPAQCLFINQVRQFRQTFRLLRQFVHRQSTAAQSFFNRFLFGFQVGYLLFQLLKLALFLERHAALLVQTHLHRLVLLSLGGCFLFFPSPDGLSHLSSRGIVYSCRESRECLLVR